MKKATFLCVVAFALLTVGFSRPYHPPIDDPGYNGKGPNMAPYRYISSKLKDSPNTRHRLDPRIMGWIQSNVSPETQLPLSFQIQDKDRLSVFFGMGETNKVEDVIERVIVEEGLVIYDGAVGQIALTMRGKEKDLELAQKPLDVYWDGSLGDLASIRAGYPVHQFIYDPARPEAVSSQLKDKGQRGFIFRIINANGRYNTRDPLDGKTRLNGFPNWPTVHWEDWKPVAGENAWVVMAAMHLYHKKYPAERSKTYAHVPEAVELKLAEEIARAAILLQADNGGIRMAPKGTYRNPKDFQSEEIKQGEWWYYQISSENNISWYAAFRMLYQVTGHEKYKSAMDGVERYFQAVWDPEERYFYQGMHYAQGQWHTNNDHFALDVQTWGVAAFGAQKIDQWFGEGTAWRMWQKSRELSGVRDEQGDLLGVGYTIEHDRLSVEWTAGAVLAAKCLAWYYSGTHPHWAREALSDAKSMRRGLNDLRHQVEPGKVAYSYSSRRGWIPFGWNSHDPRVLSLASTGWVMFVDANLNPFYLPKKAKTSFCATRAKPLLRLPRSLSLAPLSNRGSKFTQEQPQPVYR